MKLADSQYDTFSIPIHEIWVDESFNSRRPVSRDSVAELSQNIEQNGLLFPVDVQPIEEVENAPAGFKWRLIAGFRRYASVRMLQWESLPARVRTGLTERQAQILNLTENLERENLNILEEAEYIDKLFPPYRTPQSIATELKRPKKWVVVRRKLLLLSEWIQKAAASGQLTSRDLQTVIHAFDPDEKAKEILKASKEGGKSRILYNGRQVRRKTEVKQLIAKLLDEGFHPQLLRTLGWCIGEVDDEGLEEAITWLRDRKGWLR